MRPLPKNVDLSSQLGQIILLVDAASNAFILSFKSYKTRRVFRSGLAVEVIAFPDLFDNAFTIRKQTEQALNRPLPIHLMTDSKPVFDIIRKSSRESEKRPMLDISATRQAYKAKQISNIGFFSLFL